jgi:hypothetical protein
MKPSILAVAFLCALLASCGESEGPGTPTEVAPLSPPPGGASTEFIPGEMADLEKRSDEFSPAALMMARGHVVIRALGDVHDAIGDPEVQRKYMDEVAHAEKYWLMRAVEYFSLAACLDPELMADALLGRAAAKEMLGDAIGCWTDTQMVLQIRPDDMPAVLLGNWGKHYVEEWLGSPDWREKIAAWNVARESR